MYSRSTTDIKRLNPALSGGTYIVGQTTDDFENFYAVSVYMKNGGFPTGDVTFNVRPGVYNQPLILQNDIYGYDTINNGVQEHKINIQKLSGSTGSVKINWTGNSYSTAIINENQPTQEGGEEFYTDYAMYFSGYNDISIKDIEIDLEVESYVYQVGGINFTNGTGIDIENCKISFPTQDPESSYVNTYGIYLWQATDVKVSNCEIENGKYGILCESYDFCERDINISDNIFKNQLDYSIYSANWIYYCPSYNNNTVFEDNVFINDLPQTGCVEVTVTPGDLTFKSGEGSLELNTTHIITIQPQDIEIEENGSGELTIEIANTFNVTYQWFKEGDDTVLGTDEILVFTNAQESDAGLYYCVVTNDCGEVTSSSASISIKSNSMQLSVEGLRNEFEISNSPNPAKDKTTIFYKVNELGDVRIVISEMTGNELFEMNRGMTASGYYQFRIDVNKLKLNSGVYFYTLYIGNKAVTNKFVVQK